MGNLMLTELYKDRRKNTQNSRIIFGVKVLPTLACPANTSQCSNASSGGSGGRGSYVWRAASVFP